MADTLRNNFCQNKVCVFWSWWVWNSASINNFICQTIRLGQCKEILQRKSVKVLFFYLNRLQFSSFCFQGFKSQFLLPRKKKNLISKLRPLWIGSFLDIFAGCIPFSIMLLGVSHASKKKEVWEWLLWKHFYIGDELKT